MSHSEINWDMLYQLLENSPIIQRRRTAIEQLLLQKYNTYQMLIAIALSSRTQDIVLLSFIYQLLKIISHPADMLALSLGEIEDIIKPVAFYHKKAEQLYECAQILCKHYKGKVPKEIEKLCSLPGIGKKTANLLLGVCYHIPCISVDVHVQRVFNRIGVIAVENPEECEQALMAILPEHLWIATNFLFVRIGQTVCNSRVPKCALCPIQQYCAWAKKNI